MIESVRREDVLYLSLICLAVVALSESLLIQSGRQKSAELENGLFENDELLMPLIHTIIIAIFGIVVYTLWWRTEHRDSLPISKYIDPVLLLLSATIVAVVWEIATICYEILSSFLF